MISHYSYRADYEKAAKQATEFMGAWCKSVDEIDRLMLELKEANEVLRSTHSIASRAGQATNWTAFEKQVSGILERQHKILNAYFSPAKESKAG